MARKTFSLLLRSFCIFIFIIALSLTSLKAVADNAQENGLPESTGDGNGQGKGGVGPSRSGHSGSESGGNSPPSGSVKMPPSPPAMKMNVSRDNITTTDQGHGSVQTVTVTPIEGSPSGNAVKP